MTDPLPRGVFSLLATPFEEDGRLDLFAFDRILEHQGRGPCGVGIGFPIGEGQSLSLKEYRLLLEEAVLFYGGRKRVAAACFAESTGHALLLGRTAALAGADLLVVPPPYTTPEASGDYFCHLKALSRVGLPFVAYLPAEKKQERGFCDLLLCEETVRLPHFAGFVLRGLDAPCGGLWQSAHPETPLCMENDCLAAPALLSGFTALFSPLCCLLPDQTALLARECAKASPMARELQAALFPLCALLSSGEGSVLLKWGLHKKGLCAPAVRLPRTMPQERLLDQFERVLEEAERRGRRAVKGKTP